jgi:DNA-directed RNA polymerase specialized sigma subunit
MIGLLDAVDKFDPSRDIQFQTYAEYRIKGSILDELRALDWVPRGVRAAATEWERTWNEQCSTLGREPSDSEMATKLEMPLNEYHEFVAHANPLSLVTLDHLGGGGEDEGISDERKHNWDTLLSFPFPSVSAAYIIAFSYLDGITLLEWRNNTILGQPRE